MPSATTTSKQQNLATLHLFFERFQRDREGFLALWADDCVVQVPFAPPGVPRLYATRSEFLAFWDPVFQFRGKFERTIDEIIVGEDSNSIAVRTRSDVDVEIAGRRLKYAAEYIHLFRFELGKVKEYWEYVDTASMSKVYGFA
jgi:ketosteroid isomerase-like protein